MAIVGWRAWYLGDSKAFPVREYTSNETEWVDLPDDGVLGVVVYENTLDGVGNNTRIPYAGYDYYFRADGLFECLYGVDVDKRERDTMQEIAARYTNPVIKRGIWADNTTMKLVEEAIKGAGKWL